MKFNNFAKYAGSDGVIFEVENGDKWLFYGSAGMKIPEGKNVCGNITKMPEFVYKLINTNEIEPCELEGAFVPNKDSKPSELLRKFGKDVFEIDVPNKIYGFIESHDRTFIGIYDDYDNDYTALLVTDDYEDDPEFKMIYVVKD